MECDNPTTSSARPTPNHRALLDIPDAHAYAITASDAPVAHTINATGQRHLGQRLHTFSAMGKVPIFTVF